MGDSGFELCSVVTGVNLFLGLQFRCFSYCLGTRCLLLSLSTSIDYLSSLNLDFVFSLREAILIIFTW